MLARLRRTTRSDRNCRMHCRRKRHTVCHRRGSVGDRALYTGLHMRPTKRTSGLAEERPSVQKQHDRSRSLELGVSYEDHLGGLHNAVVNSMRQQTPIPQLR